MSSTSAPRRVRRSPEQRLAQLRAAARAIALEGGLLSVTQRSVAARAGVTPALVAHYAGGMDSLVAEVFAGIVGDELRELQGLVAREPDAAAQLRRLIGVLLDGTRDDVTLVWVHAWAGGAQNVELGRAVREAMDAWQALLAGIIEAGVSAGELSPLSFDPRAVADQVLAMIDGLNSHAMVQWRDGAARGALLARSLELLLGLEAGRLAAE